MLQRLGGFLQPVHTTCRAGFGVLSVKPGCHSPGSIRNYLVYLPRAHRVKKTGCSVMGPPKPQKISMSHIERQNLTVRMHLRRFTRLPNAFSKKLSNLKAALALHFAHYNFCRVNQILRVTPAMQAGLESSVWSIAELIGR
jgi:hypothetical protein